MAPYEEEEKERMAKPKWLRKTEKFFKKKAKKMFGKKKKSGGQDSSSSSEEENRGERRETTSFRRLKSSRSTKWDPDILAAWGGNPLVYSQEEPSENSEVYNIRAERVTSIYHSPSEAFLNMDQGNCFLRLRALSSPATATATDKTNSNLMFSTGGRRKVPPPSK